jgi:hypothetical protein
MNWLKKFLLKISIKTFIKKLRRNPDMKKIIEWLQGKKSYIVSLAVAAIAFCESQGYHIPEWVYTLLISFGIIAGKSALKKLEKK